MSIEVKMKPSNDRDVPEIPYEDVVRLPPPGFAIPSRYTFSPDGRWLAYLFSPTGDLVQGLYGLDLASGERRALVDPAAAAADEADISPEEALRRERQRQRALGITHYTWAGESGRLLVSLSDGLYVKDDLDGPLRKLVGNEDGPILDPQPSPDGAWVGYVQNDELYVVDAAGGGVRRLTSGAQEKGLTHGLAEFIAQEEMRRQHGFWWSEDNQWLAFTEVDESHIPLYRIMHLGKDTVGPEAQEDHRYPFAGAANAKVRLGVIARDGGEPIWMDLGQDDDIYLARVTWFPDGSLVVQIENRPQTELRLVRFDPQTGTGQTLLVERSEIWINLHDMLRPLKEGQGEFIWASERTGFMHLYLHDRDGSLLRPLTAGEWLVDAVVGVDEAADQVYFLGTKESPLEKHLYVVSLDGGAPRRITQEAGLHDVTLDRLCQRFTDLYYALNKPPTVTVRTLTDGQVVQTLHDTPDPRIERLALSPPQVVSLKNRAGVTLYGAVYRPPAEYGSGPYPTIVWVYGGPHAQLVTNNWGLTAVLRAQHLSRLGFLVFVLDNRGSARRGLAFEAPLKYKMGHVEVDDQVDGVRWLVDQGLADPARVGVYGWSYGGYMAALCLAQAPELFKVAVAGAPVTHYDGYDTYYTERYMGRPEDNPEGYEAGSVLAHVGGIQGKLLLIHGLIDENVHFRHTARLINALIRENKPYDLLLFPDSRHGPRKEADRIYLEKRLVDYFLSHLMGKEVIETGMEA